jgi:hypothetical protein
MVDEPTNLDGVKVNKKMKLMCRILEPDLQYQDCQKTDLQDIYTAHFTICGKPHWCEWSQYKEADYLICMELYWEWHKVRWSLEDEWKSEYPEYDPVYETVNVKNNYMYYLNFSQGHCGAKKGCIWMKFPALFEKSPAKEIL